MKVSRKVIVGAAALTVAASALITTSAGSAKPSKQVAGFKMAIVTDVGSIQDRSFNQLANEGRIAIGKQLGIPTRVYETKSEAERIPNALAASRAGYNLIFEVGFLNFTATDAVAPKFPTTKYAGIDQDYALFKHKPKNATGIVFAEQEGGFLVGYLAGLQIKKQGGKQIISAVGANNVPAIVHYLAGFRAGAKKADPKVTVLINYANDPTFNDQTKCKVTTQNQISRGSGIVFEAAGGCGLGGLTAAKQAGIWGIGVDANQGFLGPHILTSALKKVDVAVYDAIKEFKADPTGFKGGVDTVYDLKNGGVGYAPLSTKVSAADRTYITAKVNAIAKQIASGKIVPPTK